MALPRKGGPLASPSRYMLKVVHTDASSPSTCSTWSPLACDKVLVCLLNRVYGLSKGKETWAMLSYVTGSCLRMDQAGYVFQVFHFDTRNKTLGLYPMDFNVECQMSNP